VRFRLFGLFLGIIATFAFVLRAEASPITTGDVFHITFTDTSANATAFLDSDPSQTSTILNPDFGSVTSADFVLGALFGPGVFRIAQIKNPVGAPPFLTVDLSGLFFNATLLGLTGTLDDTFTGGGGGLHHEILTPALPAAFGSPGTWDLSDDHVDGGFTLITHGVYTVSQTPEPISLILLGSGIAAGLVRRPGKKNALTRRFSIGSI